MTSSFLGTQARHLSHDEVRITLLESQVVVALLVVGGGSRNKQSIDRLIVAESSRVLPIRASLIKQLHGRARQTSDDCDVASFYGRTSKSVHRLRQHFPNGVKWTRLTLSLCLFSRTRQLCELPETKCTFTCNYLCATFPILAV